MGRFKQQLSFEPDEVQTCEAMVEFYEKRLDEALAKLGDAIERKEQRAQHLSVVRG